VPQQKLVLSNLAYSQLDFKGSHELFNQDELTAAKVAVGSVYLTLQNVLSTIVGVSGYAFMARVITREEMGLIAGLTFTAAFVQLISNLGLDSSIAKFVSELKGKGENVSPHILSALALRLPLSLTSATILALFSTTISTTLFKTPAHSHLITLLAIDTILLSLAPLLNNILLGLGKLKNMAIYGTLSVIIRWFSITIFLLNGQSLNGILYGWIAGDASFLLMLTLTTTKTSAILKTHFTRKPTELSNLLKFSWPIYISSIVNFLYTQYDKALILAFLPLSSLGIYNIAYTAFSALVSIAMSLGSSLFPYYGMAYGKNNHTAITFAIKRASKYIMLAMFPLTLGLAATAKPTITLFAGQQYETGWPILAILSLFGLVYGLSPAFSNLLLIYGKTKTILLINLASITASLTLLPLMLFLNLTGLAIIRGISILLTFTLSLHFISKTIKIEIDRKAAAKTLLSSTIMATAVILTQQITYNKLLIPLYITIGAATYAASIRALKTLNHEDIQLLKEITGEKTAKLITKILGI